jgi:hypothetical protein
MNDAKLKVDDRKRRFVVHANNLGLDTQLDRTKLNLLIDQLEVEAVIAKINRDSSSPASKSKR